MNISTLRIPAVLISILLVFIVACGSLATATPAPGPTTAPAATASSGDTAAPTAVPAAAAAPTAMPAPTQAPSTGAVSSASLHIVVTPLLQDSYYPWLMTSDGFLPLRPLAENPTTIAPRTGVSTVLPQLFTEWEMSSDALEFNFRIRKGVQFHFGWGEYTAKDFILSLDQSMRSDSISGCSSVLKAAMGTESATEMVEAGNLNVVDDYDITMSLATPRIDLVSWYLNILSVTCAAGWSSDQFAAEGDGMFETGHSRPMRCRSVQSLYGDLPPT